MTKIEKNFLNFNRKKFDENSRTLFSILQIYSISLSNGKRLNEAHSENLKVSNFLEVTIIPTYDTDVLGYWVSENEEMLAKNHIDLSPSAARCTINLQDHETSCSAYRLEFQATGIFVQFPIFFNPNSNEQKLNLVQALKLVTLFN